MKDYWHSVVLEMDHCNGCTHCLEKCPTQAIRVINGKARIIEDRCIDCGECLAVCPRHAKGALSNTLEDIENYKYTVALPAISTYGQFPLEYDMNKVFNGLIDLGFDDVYDVAYAAELLTTYEKEVLAMDKVKKPVISTYCPVITRLIQIRFPALIDNITKLESPMEIAARIVKRKLVEEGHKFEDIGVFYVTPCPAKITSIKTPIGLEKSYIDGAISFEEVYYKIMKIYDDIESDKDLQKSNGSGIGWGRVGGQSYAMKIDDYIAVDGIESVIEVLENLELGKLDELDFFEGYACINGCVGGPLNIENTFIAKNRLRKNSKAVGESHGPIQIDVDLTTKNFEWDEEIKPLSILRLDNDFKVALKKMQSIEKINKSMPGINCGACGAPSCRVLAEDIVGGFAYFEDCVVMQHRVRKRGIVDNYKNETERINDKAKQKILEKQDRRFKVNTRDLPDKS